MTSRSQSPARNRVPATLTIFLGIIGVTLFVATEAFAAAVAGAWAFAGLFGLSDTVFFGFAGVLSIGAAVATVMAARLAWLAETHPDNN